ncbi:tail fiber domain-containing protein [Neorhizobium sp. NPDC001467]|uniref:tail fiber domain-containing protein n=1 Tax=Neorhizobium sp. NPDC001467 TaxID=3390595 RepID=UPI003CFD024F
MYGSAPQAPDPKETAAAQTGTNISTATANSWLSNINQVTPDGSLTYSQTGSAFTPSETGQTYYYNPKTGEYSTNKKITGYTPATPSTSPANGGLMGYLSGETRGGSANGGQPIYEDGWQQVKGMLVPTFTATQTLSPAQQAIKNQEDQGNLNLATLWNTQSGKLNTLLKDPFSISGAPAAGNASSLTAPQYQQFGSGPQLQTSVGNAGDITKSYDIDFDTSKYQDALMAKLQPSLDQNRAATEQKLANQGLMPGTPAYDRAYAAVTAQENDARYGAILNAGQEQTRLANLAQQQASFQNAAQQQGYNQAANNMSMGNAALQQQYQNLTSSTAANNALQDQSFNAQQAMIDAQNRERANYLNEQYAQRNQNLNEVLGLASGTQLSNPNFVPTQGQTMPTVDYAGLVQQDYQNKLGAYNQSQAGIGSILGGIGSIFSMSDRDAKKDINKVGGLYEYRYKDDPKGTPKRIGVMAQEVEKVRPGAVREGTDGYKRVNYGALFAAGGAR